MFWKAKETPYRRLLRELGLRRKPLSGSERRRVLKELEQIKVQEPEFYNALLRAKAELEQVAQAMYPPAEEHRRLLANESPEGS